MRAYPQQKHLVFFFFKKIQKLFFDQKIHKKILSLHWSPIQKKKNIFFFESFICCATCFKNNNNQNTQKQKLKGFFFSFLLLKFLIERFYKKK